MATNFPTSLDSLTNPAAGDSQSSPSHAAQHSNVNDAVEALQAKVGVDGSAVTGSLDYKVANQGLVLVKSQAIGSGAASVTVTDAFSSTFLDYMIVGQIGCTINNTTVNFTLTGVTGTPYDGVTYYNTFGAGTAESVFAYNNATAADIGHWRYGGSMIISQPNTTGYKGFSVSMNQDVTYMRRGGGRIESTTASTGFTITPGTGTFSFGSIRIYGFNQG